MKKNRKGESYASPGDEIGVSKLHVAYDPGLAVESDVR